eukprot:scaffold8181_cov116-Isochrysis_galbana.AAC.1
MGDPALYPKIRTARHMYALQWLPREVRDDRPLLQQQLVNNNGWIDNNNNMTYLDARALVVFQDGDADFRRDTWAVYHNLHMCRLGVCPHWLWSLDVYGLSTSTPTVIIIHSCPICFDPELPNPQIFPARSIAEASAQFQVRDPTVEREGCQGRRGEKK